MTVADKLNTYTTIGNREDLSGQVADLFADDVPAFALAKKTKADSTKHEWLTDVLASASKTGVVEGATVTYTKPGLRTRRQNMTAIRVRSWQVTHSQNKMNAAGIPDQIKREVMKAMKSLLVDFDAIILNSATSAVGTTATARMAKGIQRAISTNTAKGTGGGNTCNVFLKEGSVNSILQKIWQAGGDPRVLICGGFQKRVISQNFTAKTGFTWQADQSTRKAINNINQYEGSFGTLQIIPDRNHMARRVTILTPDMFRVAIYRDIEQYAGAKTASSIDGWVEAEMTLDFGNEKGHGRCSYLKTTGL